MSKLLTIAIPTYNRAAKLDKQLAWIARAIKGFESECEIFVSDNCSTDQTQEIIQKWQQMLPSVTFKSHKQPENLGVMKNIIHCIKSATTKYVWTIGDDDPIQERAVPYLITQMHKHQDLSLLFLNFSGRNQITGEPVHPPTIPDNRWFNVDAEDGYGDSQAIYGHCFAESVGAVIFLTASIYRSELAQKALNIWQDASENWISLAYIAGYCAANGKIIVTKDTYMECIVGVSYWQKIENSAVLMQYKHLPEVILKLEENGFSKQFCRKMMVKSYQDANLKVFLGALRRWPLFTLRIMIPFWISVIQSVIYLLTERFFKSSERKMLSPQVVSK
ncbi:glycosyltransferase family 2 protein [Calothrix sp. 336/3]|uniref:glycosyltransferase family 2 protein n=1 Tax=Calothrix sp. 336/3 TaxID=1337936 RepID=UPI0005522F9A|nr:glycosyltransferase family 2 protein [Calothrix sp. 336/3]AKG23277.1 glycosyltransferase [Calothrix sp. 336/3]